MEMDVMLQDINCHVVAIPYPGRGHINPMMNLCNLIATHRPNILVTFIVTEEWLGFLSSETKPPNIRFASVPNVIPSEVNRAADFAGFYRTTLTKLPGPVESLLDRLDKPVSVIIHDTNLMWVVELGNRRNIPVASLWTMSATVFSMFYHYDLLVEKGYLPINLTERGQELVDCIPGVLATRIIDLPTPFYDKDKQVLGPFIEAIHLVPNAQYLLFTTVYELEAKAIDALKAKLPTPIYSIGPAIPYLKQSHAHNDLNSEDYVKWLDSQPKGSVMYISQGSFLSVSSAQLDEIIAGVHDSGIRFFWVTRGVKEKFQNGEKGFVVPWCDQLKVLCHCSIGGFWSHCGWNSTKEGVFAGVPILTFPIFWDQVPNSKRIVEDWKTGWRVKKWGEGDGILVKRGEISRLLKRFMDLDSEEGKEIRKRVKELMEICRRSTSKGGSSEINISSFVKDISKCKGY